MSQGHGCGKTERQPSATAKSEAGQSRSRRFVWVTAMSFPQDYMRTQFLWYEHYPGDFLWCLKRLAAKAGWQLTFLISRWTAAIEAHSQWQTVTLICDRWPFRGLLYIVLTHSKPFTGLGQGLIVVICRHLLDTVKIFHLICELAWIRTWEE